jgi:hypothetical protein
MDTVRAGLHYVVNEGSDVIASFMHQKGDDLSAFSSPVFDDEGNPETDEQGNPVFEVLRSPASTFGDIGEAQYLLRAERFSVIAGGGYSSSGFTPSGQSTTHTKHANGYLYSYVHYLHNVTWTIGLSYDSLKHDRVGRFEQPNPKLGLLWNVTPNTTVRLAWFRALKRSLLTNQTIEPTQVAGFNQFFDDFLGTEARRYGIATDHQFTEELYGGLEFSARELTVPTRIGETFRSDWDEKSYRAYVDWTPNPRIAAKLAYELEDFEASRRTSFLAPDTTTHIAEVGLRFYDPSGFFSHVDTMCINQRTFSPLLFEPPAIRNDFWIVNAGVGYRLPKRLGILRLEVRNLLDENFNFQSGGLSRLLKNPVL